MQLSTASTAIICAAKTPKSTEMDVWSSIKLFCWILVTDIKYWGRLTAVNQAKLPNMEITQTTFSQSFLHTFQILLIHFG